MSKENLAKLVKSRGSLKARLTKFIHFVDACEDEPDKCRELPSRIEKISEAWGKFDEIQSEIEEIDDSDKQLNERDIFEDEYHAVITRARDLCPRAPEPAPPGPPVQNEEPINNLRDDFASVRLPIIDLPKFDGSCHQWLTFNDLFKSLIDNNPRLSNSQKLHYLKSSVTGEAQALIETLEAILNLPVVNKESHTSLRQLVSDFSKHLEILRKLEQPVQTWDTILIQIVIPKLDSASLREWEKERVNIAEMPTLRNFTDFLSNRCTFLESIARPKQPESTTTQFKNKSLNTTKGSSASNRASSTSYSHFGTSGSNCPVCRGSHRLFQCNVFRNLSIASKQNEIRNHKLCRNCLKSYHGNNCTAGACKLCNKHHHTLLHSESVYGNTANPTTQHKVVSETTANADNKTWSDSFVRPPSGSITIPADSHQNLNDTTLIHVASQRVQQILLSTAIVMIDDRFGRTHRCRALLDSGSQSNLMTQSLKETLQLISQPANISIMGINQTSANAACAVNTTVRSIQGNFRVNLPFLVMNKITNQLPAAKVDLNRLCIPTDITLADPLFHTPGEVDILLGASIFWELICPDQIQTSKNHPILQKTRVGWIVSGAVNYCHASSVPAHLQCCFASNMELNQQLERFWQIEEISNDTHLSLEQQECVQHFADTHTRSADGRFVVELPFKSSPHQLGDSRASALKRLLMMEKRLEKNPELRIKYNEFMHEYLDLGHMEEVLPSDNDVGLCYYIPHHPVVKTEASTIKIRVVFDGSAKTSSGKSLNDLLSVGPTIQHDLLAILLRFRQNPYAMTAEVTKMYRQVMLHPKHRRFQRILWRWNPNEHVKTFELSTVTYGLASSSYLAIECLQQPAKIHFNEYPTASQTILSDFYVDDLLTGGSEPSKLSQLKDNVVKVLSTARFELSKWKTNCPELIHGKGDCSAIKLGEETKILGLFWDTQKDALYYRVDIAHINPKATKRSILSIVSQIFDPLGLIGPINIVIKIILQSLWKSKTDWDEPIDSQLERLWQQWLDEIVILNSVTIPRHILCDKPARTEIHGFSDASESAYGACLYVRSLSPAGTYTVRLHCAKSKVAPLKNHTLPRLELCAAVLLASLCHKALQSISISIDEIHYWSDSSVALCWIAAEPHNWPTFVANRVAEIRRLTDYSQWHHVPSEENPADIISRGINPKQIKGCTLWWEGPTFLKEEIHYRPRPCSEEAKTDEEVEMDEPLNENLKSFAVTSNDDQDERLDLQICSRFSSFQKLKRVISYCLRFKTNATNRKNPENQMSGPLSADELKRAESSLIKLVQSAEFSNELQSLRQNKSIQPQSKIASLFPISDENGILRVGGRIANAPLEYDTRHPILLPKEHPFTASLIRAEHYRNLHAGNQALLAFLRTRYWIVSGRTAVRKILRKCIVCFRARPIKLEQLMGNLPTSRLQPTRPFLTVGVDYGGPFSIKVSRNVTGKAYLCLFTCFSTRAAHLEVASSLSTDAFLNCMKRFIARRGLCKVIYSDNGSNFVGASNELKKLAETIARADNVHDFMADQGIKWQFIPPYSPHMGGLWEATIKSAKLHLKKVIGDTKLTFEELYTTFTLIESCLNSRPLTPLSQDPTDLQVLTPGHFIIGEPLNSMPEVDFTDTPANRLTRFGLITQLRQQFWTRWFREYVGLLQHRNKWKKISPNLLPGMMVLLREDHTPPMHWPLGRIVEVHPGKDGLVRVATIRTSSGVCQRSTAKLCLLPIEGNEALAQIES